MDSNSVTAWATAILAIITIWYAISTHKLLEETQVARKINAVEKKLEEFYIPFQQHLLFNDKSVKESFKKDTAQAHFMKYRYLCRNENLRFLLNKFFDPQSEIEPYIQNIKDEVDKDIDNLKRELDTLLGIRKG